MNNIERLTASRTTCEKLVELGIIPWAFFWHVVEDDPNIQDLDKEGNPVLMHEVCMLANPNYRPGIYGTIPAWTKYELDVMIGPLYPKAELYDPNDLSRTTAELKEHLFPVYYPDKVVEFTSGAEASAQILIYLITKKHLNPVDCMARYKKIFTD